MIRLISIAFVIWGLIAQPLMAAVPVSSMDANPCAEMFSRADAKPLSMERHSSLSSGDISKTVVNETCDNCETECIDGMCVSSCVSSGAAAFQKSSVNFDLFCSSLFAASSGVRAYSHPSRIFHPPKHT